MSLLSVREALIPRAHLLRNVLVALLGAAALIIGLVAMHSLSLDSGHHGSEVILTVDGHHADAIAGSATAVAGECAGDGCGTDHGMTLAACVLALLVVTIAIGAAAHSESSVDNESHAVRSAVPQAARLVPPPPSLVSLSISRT